ncbi:hypothetical protein C8F04DRAFT_1269959 [Mycena alexandri]|uniref:DUF6534 domain-containing protein n=1 Tax=Mycena alexandri TaxID=1745969 RepID=A0AAD6WVD2_9AGAR|nr:hypothetical protein C8F04DRAFT_1269959 [Mycena alexandri]
MPEMFKAYDPTTVPEIMPFPALLRVATTKADKVKTDAFGAKAFQHTVQHGDDAAEEARLPALCRAGLVDNPPKTESNKRKNSADGNASDVEEDEGPIQKVLTNKRVAEKITRRKKRAGTSAEKTVVVPPALALSKVFGIANQDRSRQIPRRHPGALETMLGSMNAGGKSRKAEAELWANENHEDWETAAATEEGGELDRQFFRPFLATMVMAWVDEHDELHLEWVEALPQGVKVHQRFENQYPKITKSFINAMHGWAKQPLQEYAAARNGPREPSAPVFTVTDEDAAFGDEVIPWASIASKPEEYYDTKKFDDVVFTADGVEGLKGGQWFTLGAALAAGAGEGSSGFFRKVSAVVEIDEADKAAEAQRKVDEAAEAAEAQRKVDEAAEEAQRKVDEAAEAQRKEDEARKVDEAAAKRKAEEGGEEPSKRKAPAAPLQPDAEGGGPSQESPQNRRGRPKLSVRRSGAAQARKARRNQVFDIVPVKAATKKEARKPEFRTIPVPMGLWLSAAAVTDTAIAIILIVEHLKNPRDSGVAKNIIQLTFETGAVTAVVAVLNLILYFAIRSTTYHFYPMNPNLLSALQGLIPLLVAGGQASGNTGQAALPPLPVGAYTSARPQSRPQAIPSSLSGHPNPNTSLPTPNVLQPILGLSSLGVSMSANSNQPRRRQASGSVAALSRSQISQANNGRLTAIENHFPSTQSLTRRTRTRGRASLPHL